MAAILQLETSVTVCSVAIAVDGVTVALKEENERNIHAGSLTLFIDDVMKQAGLNFDQLGAVAVAKGPGSYTGLRIGVSTAKGICFALDIPLIAIGTLEMMTNGFLIQNPSYDGYICPMIDARRMEVYTALYDNRLNEIDSVQAKIVDHHTLENVLDNQKVAFLGDGSPKCKSLITSDNALFYSSNFNSAGYMSDLAWSKFQNEKFENTAYFEPFYLKDFVITSPKNR